MNVSIDKNRNVTPKFMDNCGESWSRWVNTASTHGWKQPWFGEQTPKHCEDCQHMLRHQFECGTGSLVISKLQHIGQYVANSPQQVDDWQWLFLCNKLLTCQKGRTCYKTTMATEHIKKHDEQTETDKVLGKQATHRRAPSWRRCQFSKDSVLDQPWLTQSPGRSCA